jgi:hypothetical protein
MIVILVGVYATICVVPYLSAGAAEEVADTGKFIATLKSVGPEGKRNAEAREALRRLVESDAKSLPVILRSFRDADPLAANWLRSAVETIADRTLRKGDRLPEPELEKFILDRSQNARARRLAFELLVKVDDGVRDRLVPGMLNDPSPEMRRDAVTRLIDEAKQLKADESLQEAIAVYRKALSGAVNDDQVKQIVEPLKELGEEVDLQRHFGFLSRWSLIGPFNNKDRVGFGTTYPPEEKIELAAQYPGQLGEVKWQPLSTEDDYGIVDVAKQISPYKGAVMYATTEYHSNDERNVELRLGTPNAWILWVNGKKVFDREEYHRGTRLDQYRVPVKLKPGRNTILLKLCQNEQTQDWAQRYQFQLRVCDAAGAGVVAAKQ